MATDLHENTPSSLFHSAVDQGIKISRVGIYELVHVQIDNKVFEHVWLGIKVPHIFSVSSVFFLFCFFLDLDFTALSRIFHL